MIQLGTALKSQEPPFHPLPDYFRSPSKWRDGRARARIGTIWSVDSTVAYSTCKFGSAVKPLEAAIQRGLFLFQRIASSPIAALRKVIGAAKVSPGMPPGAKKLLAQI